MITSVRLQNFRCFTDKTVEFDKGINLIVGKNGVGKTTILEAIYATLNGKSWRGRDEQLIMHNKDWARVDVTGEKRTYSLTLDARSGRLVKKQLTNDKPTKNSELKTILFEPDFILTFTTKPDKRRQWVDDLLEQLHPEYTPIRNNYKRALLQRNRLLKQSKFTHDSLFVWNLKLSEYGGQVARYRNELIEDINQHVTAAYRTISRDQSEISLNYRQMFPIQAYATAHLAQLEESIEKDRVVGFTTSGPHREDIEAMIDNEYFSEAASRGEFRTLSMALKKIERDMFKGTEVVELYDDAFSELDVDRSAELLKEKKNQKIITSAEEIKTTQSTIRYL